MSILDNDIKYLPGVGPKRAEALARALEMKVCTYGDLLRLFPFRYVDKTRIYAINELGAEAKHVLLRGKVTGFRKRTAHSGKEYLTATFSDGTGTVELVWYHYTASVLKDWNLNTTYTIYAEDIGLFNGMLSIVHPEMELQQAAEGQITSKWQGIYPSTKGLKSTGMSRRVMTRVMSGLLQKVNGQLPETLPPHIVAAHRLMPLNEAMLNIHFPQSEALLKRAEARIKFEEFFYMQLQLLRSHAKRIKSRNGLTFDRKKDRLLKIFFQRYLKFRLTEAQVKVMKEISANVTSGMQMNRLLQGDVGSGKTIVALLCALMAADNGYKTCIMAPTEILAAQHYASISESLREMDVSVLLLTGSTKAAERKKLDEQLKSDNVCILIGTHAVIENTVEFKRLGLVVIDEQHRFGVAQRGKMWDKGDDPPHILVMTATPIPRTLAMTQLCDLEVSVIDQLPPGRKPITTRRCYDTRRGEVYEFMRCEIAKGRQVYVVYPLIEESETVSYQSLQEGYESITQAFPAPRYSVCMVHGQLKPGEKERAMQRFVDGEAQIMVATTVIEVGVNVPNASVMVIESAERFGLAQLHQLRGRVGRGADQSYCILMSGVKLSSNSRQRLEILCSTNDGFKIAEADLQMRGQGDLEGTQQSGQAYELRLAEPYRDSAILEYAHAVAKDLLADDPTLSAPQNAIVRSTLAALKSEMQDYSAVS